MPKHAISPLAWLLRAIELSIVAVLAVYLISRTSTSATSGAEVSTATESWPEAKNPRL